MNEEQEDLKGMSLSAWAQALIPKDEWLRGEKRAMIDGTCYIQHYDDLGHMCRYEAVNRHGHPQSNRERRKDYVPEYNTGYLQR